MDFLLGNPIATMEGVPFLVLYGSVIFFTLTTLGYFKSKLDSTDGLPIPAIPPVIDPFETAFLRGGPNELARTLVFALRQKGLIVIANGEKKAFLRPSQGVGAASGGLTDIESRTLEWIGTERDTAEVFSGRTSLVDAVDRWCNLYQYNLERQLFLTGTELYSNLRRWKWTALAVIAGLGGYKILAALANGYSNVFFAILLLTGGMIAAFVIGRRPRRTKLGTLYLERLRTVFEPTKIEATKHSGPVGETVPATGFASVDPLLISVGVFGTATLAGSLYPDYNEAFRKHQQDASGGGGGCGSSCGSGCSSGSSGCGSGCGGCGGGCGG